MYAYLRTYQLAVFLARRHLSEFQLSPYDRLFYIIKAANLAICFLGYSIHSGEAWFRRSAELGVLGSIFDLASDGRHFAPTAVRTFRSVVDAITAGETRRMILDLFDRKERRQLPAQGLERGVDALRIVLSHLRVEESWPSEAKIYEVGVLCQVVDDLLDVEGDLARGELNFLRHPNSTNYIQMLMAWNYEEQFCNCPHSYALLYAIKKAKNKAKRLLARPIVQDGARAAAG